MDDHCDSSDTGRRVEDAHRRSKQATLRSAGGAYRGDAMNELRIAYTPDSDDVFTFCGWEHGHIESGLDAVSVSFERGHIRELNEAARQEVYDVVAVSSVIYPSLSDRYWILAVGTSVGRGWGPIVASKRFDRIEQLAGKRVGVGGHPTTGSVLTCMFGPTCELVSMPYDEIADAVVADQIDAGVMIHEELLHFAELGLTKVLDLGSAWEGATGSALPVGLNLVHHRVGMETARRIATACQRSLCWANENYDQAIGVANRFGRGKAEKHVSMFSNEDTLCLPNDVRGALRILFDRIAAMGHGPRINEFVVVDGEVKP